LGASFLQGRRVSRQVNPLMNPLGVRMRVRVHMCVCGCIQVRLCTSVSNAVECSRKPIRT
jgi:hypothetical protein